MPFNKIIAESMDLSDTYAFTGTVSGAGGGALVKTGSLTSTTNGLYNLDGCFSATYLNYFVTFKYAIATDGNRCHLRFRTGGSTNSQSNYQSYILGGYQDTSAFSSNNANGNHAILGTDMEATDAQGMQGFMYIFNPFSTSTYTQVTVHMNSKHNGGAKRFHFGGIMFDDTTSFDGIQLTQDTGDGSFADLQVWGIKE